VTPAESDFVEEMGQVLAAYGMTPMAGRMWGWLLICEPPEQTAAEIAGALGASRGAISGTARILAGAGFIKRGTRRGDRREFFSAPPEALESMLGSATQIYRRLREMSERGLRAVAYRPVDEQARLQEFHDVLAFVEREVPLVIDGFIRERAGARAATNAPRQTAGPDRQEGPAA
jgi:DNA-binding transcriptional regulator GbsR (MarR family)